MDCFEAHLHNATISKMNDTIGRHFSLPVHNYNADMKIHILDFIHAHPESGKGAYLRNKIEFK